MDGDRFDAVVRALAGGMPRRRVLGHLGAGAPVVLEAALLGRRDVAEAGSACRERMRSCTSGNQCCGRLSACRPIACSGLPGRRCCGRAGARCDPTEDSCDCCGDLICDSGTRRCG